uniref:Membrane-associated oxidoreductase n=1 Tax=Candidatus Nitrotoga fabula TaxID=2182327 RepID=A0A2X0QU20_9PROT
MTPARKPKGRTLAEFEPLRPAEKLLLDACWQGKVAHIAESRPEAAHENNTVRAGFLRFLALGGDEQAPVHERGVQLQGAWITDALNLTSASVPSGLRMVHCQFSEMPIFTGTNIAGTLDFTDSQLPGFFGTRMTVNGTVFLNKAKATKNVHLLGIQIDGNLECTEATFDDKEGNALFADDTVIKGTVFLKKTHATGTVHLIGAQIGGDLDCTDAIFDGENENRQEVDKKKSFALSADLAVIKGTVLLKQATASGNVHLLGAQIGGDLDCAEATFDGKGGNALSADGAVIRHSIHLDKFTAKGNVCLMGIQVGGTLECEGAKFKGTKKQDGSHGRALSADGMKIKQTCFSESWPTQSTESLSAAPTSVT